MVMNLYSAFSIIIFKCALQASNLWVRSDISIQLFWERLSEKVHATILKGIVGDFKCTVFQRNLKESYGRPLIYVCECWRKVTKVGSTATVVRNRVLIISRITFRDCRVHFILDKLSRNSCIQAPLAAAISPLTISPSITCCIRLATLLGYVATCWMMLDQIWKLSNFSCNILDVAWCCTRLATFTQHCCAWACALGPLLARQGPGAHEHWHVALKMLELLRAFGHPFNTCRNIM